MGIFTPSRQEAYRLRTGFSTQRHPIERDCPDGKPNMIMRLGSSLRMIGIGIGNVRLAVETTSLMHISRGQLRDFGTPK
eukprot:1638617-Amphidinium_carterae.1